MKREEINQPFICKGCGRSVLGMEVPPPAGSQHGSKLICPHCQSFKDWIKKEKNDTKSNRGASAKNLVKKTGIQYCQMCLLKEVDLHKRGTGLHAHHVIPFKESQNDSLTNIWVVCIPCHDYIHYVRRSYGSQTLGDIMQPMVENLKPETEIKLQIPLTLFEQ